MSCARCKTYFLKSGAYFQERLSSDGVSIEEKHIIRQLELLLEETCFYVGSRELSKLSAKARYEEYPE